MMRPQPEDTHTHPPTHMTTLAGPCDAQGESTTNRGGLWRADAGGLWRRRHGRL